VIAQAQARGLISAEHFTADGTLIEAWAGQKSFQRRNGKQASPEDEPTTWCECEL
jgi:transposase